MWSKGVYTCGVRVCTAFKPTCDGLWQSFPDDFHSSILVAEVDCFLWKEIGRNSELQLTICRNNRSKVQGEGIRVVVYHVVHVSQVAELKDVGFSPVLVTIFALLTL